MPLKSGLPSGVRAGRYADVPCPLKGIAAAVMSAPQAAAHAATTTVRILLER